ncbi:MAG: DUF4097 family beta strand repeat protein [Anaerolineae bacterium]|nr:DUF4097 family beta strand repeat protein [Anaerolineae bacterium]
MTELQSQTHIHLDGCQGDLVLKGWDSSEVSIQGQETLAKDAIRQTEDGEIHLAQLPECTLYVPRQATVSIGPVTGSLTVESFEGKVEVSDVYGDVHLKSGNIRAQRVHGDFKANKLAESIELDTALSDVSLRDVAGDVVLRQAGGDVRARRIDGALRIDAAQGDVRVRSVAGLLELGHIAGDAVLKGLPGGVTARQVDGEVVLKTDLSPEARYSVRARGDIVLKVPWQVSASFVFEAPEGEIHSTIPLTLEEEAAGRLVGTLGDTAQRAEVHMHTTEGNITLKPHITLEDSSVTPEEWGFTAEAFAKMVQSQVADSLGTSDVTEFVQHKMERALRQAERAFKRQQRRSERRAKKVRRWRLSHQQKQAPPYPPAEPVTDEERLTILKMLAAGTITAEEADKLLEALES